MKGGGAGGRFRDLAAHGACVVSAAVAAWRGGDTPLKQLHPHCDQSAR